MYITTVLYLVFLIHWIICQSLRRPLTEWYLLFVVLVQVLVLFDFLNNTGSNRQP